jgi:hypothetical protein
LDHHFYGVATLWRAMPPTKLPSHRAAEGASKGGQVSSRGGSPQLSHRTAAKKKKKKKPESAEGAAMTIEEGEEQEEAPATSEPPSEVKECRPSYHGKLPAPSTNTGKRISHVGALPPPPGTSPGKDDPPPQWMTDTIAEEPEPAEGS